MPQWIRELLQAIGRLFPESFVTARTLVEFLITHSTTPIQRLTFTNANGEGDVRVYARSLRRLFWFSALAPFAVLLVGFMCQLLPWQWSLRAGVLLASCAGLFWAILSVVLGAFAAPIGALVAALERVGADSESRSAAEVLRESAERYVQFARIVIFTEMSVALFFAVVPVRNNLWAFPLFLLAVGILWIAGLLSRKLSIALATGTAIWLLFTFVSPDIASAVQRLFGATGLQTRQAIHSVADSLERSEGTWRISIPLDDNWEWINLRAHNVPSRIRIDFVPERAGDSIFVRHMGIVHTKRWNDTDFRPSLPDSMSPTIEMRGSRPMIMAIQPE